ncbi:NAD-dependent epimerase/dehydratase family protein [Hwangdonia seohaensis]|uniref:NAD-dependent epimerase/dehydratase family protein n=1 Tax=Hwangdonia seohaensis TaxID=1240727 RepID=A0ABW3REC7_9FLAO|nr:NAD-dependent epimerase/dehydratase family protein [Hwangdonia seohaensis]
MENSKSRRDFIKKSTAAGIAIPLLASNLLACNSNVSSKKLKILILGGTSFLGPHQITYALKRGHSVSIFTRGKTKSTVHKELFNQVEHLIGDRNDNLKALEQGAWDLVIDNSGRQVKWTKDTANLLKDRAKLYLYTSSTGVYYPYLGDHITENTTTLTEAPETFGHKYEKLEYDYGVMKTNSENETIKAFGKERSIIVRPTYMFGPGDKTNRFIHWPIRLAKGGEILVPGKKEDPVQYIDVRDVAEFMIRLAEQKHTGIYNAVGPKEKQTMVEFVNEAKETFPKNATITNIDDYTFLEENGINYLVPWIPSVGKNYGSARISNTKSRAAGLTFRNLKTSIKDMYDWWYSDALTNEQRVEYEKNPKTLLNTEQDILKAWNTLKM